MRPIKQLLLGVAFSITGMCTASWCLPRFAFAVSFEGWVDVLHRAIVAGACFVSVLAPIPGLVLIANALYRLALWDGGELAPPPRVRRDSEPPVVGGGYR